MKPKFDHKVKRPRAWVPSGSTDVSKTFARVRREMAEKEREAEAKITRIFKTRSA